MLDWSEPQLWSNLSSQMYKGARIRPTRTWWTDEDRSVGGNLRPASGNFVRGLLGVGAFISVKSVRVDLCCQNRGLVFEIFSRHVSIFIQRLEVMCCKNKTTKDPLYSTDKLRMCLIIVVLEPELKLIDISHYWYFFFFFFLLLLLLRDHCDFLFPPCLQKPSVGLDKWEYFEGILDAGKGEFSARQMVRLFRSFSE